MTKKTNFLLLTLFAVIVGAGPRAVAAAADVPSSPTTAAASVVTGRVLNSATNAFLEGARIQLEGTDRVGFTDIDVAVRNPQRARRRSRPIGRTSRSSTST